MTDPTSPSSPGSSETSAGATDGGARDEGPGARLLAERRRQGLSLGDIARQLKLSVRQVEALERDDYSGFAGPVFVRGFLRNYAKLLRLDSESLLEAAELGAASPVPPQQVQSATNVSVPGAERGRRVLGITALVILAVVALVLLASNAARERHELPPPQGPGPSLALQAPAASPPHPDSPPRDSEAQTAAQAGGPVGQEPPASPSQPAEPPSAPAAQPPNPTLATEAVHPAAVLEPSPAAPSAASAQPRVITSGSGPAQIHMAFEDESWVEIKDASGATIYSRLNNPGTERVVKGTPPFSLVVGNAHGVKVRYKDKAVDLGPHTRVDVARVVLE